MGDIFYKKRCEKKHTPAGTAMPDGAKKRRTRQSSHRREILTRRQYKQGTVAGGPFLMRLSFCFLFFLNFLFLCRALD